MPKYYITTPIFYVNAPPHIGHAFTSIAADVLARYHRQKGDEVFFQTGTDEHGVKIVRAAEAASEEPARFVDKIAETFNGLKELLNLSWDAFARTTDQKKHWPKVHEIWKKLDAAGDLYKKSYRGLYCVGHETFVTEKDLESGICRDHKAKPELIEEENWFFRLSKYTKQIEAIIKNNELRIIPETRKNEILSLLKEGLEDVSFSRPRKDLQWGIPVPGDESQTVYVWCDALVNYLDDEKVWPADAHVIGKDILRFHAAIWPGMLLSAGLPLPKSILVHGFITVDGEKMSKTVGNIVDPFELVKKYGTDAVRYYLLSEIPSGEDGDFSVEKFEARYNGNLANGLGNFAARTLTLASSAKLNSVVPQNEIKKASETVKEKVERAIVAFKLHEALQAIWELISFGDKYINENKPWEKSEAGNPKSEIIGNALYILENVAELLKPFLPETAEKILKAIEHGGDNTVTVRKIAPLFPRLP